MRKNDHSTDSVTTIAKVLIVPDLFKTLVLTSIIVSILGYIDYITGEISIDILYMLCVITVSWFSNRIIGILCIAEILFAKITADHFDHVVVGSHLYEWNTFNYLIIYLIVCILVGGLKKVLSK
jgi:hypothetical protein